MKKVSLLVGTILFAGVTAFGQNTIGSGANNIEAEYVLEAPTESGITHNKKVVQGGSLAAPGQLFINEDFGSGKIPSGWTVHSTSHPKTSWIWSDKGSQGQYSGKTASPPRNWAINSTTGSNGFMILDCDNLNPGSSSGFSTVDAYVEIPLPSLVGVKVVGMTFEHFWRPFSNVEMYVLIQKGSGSWDTVRVDHGVAVNSLSSTSLGLANNGDAYLEEIDLSKYIAGAANSKIRIHWGGSSHYYWQIDDIKIFEGPTNKITTDDTKYYAHSMASAGDSIYTNYINYYSRMPVKQANIAETGFSGVYHNAGAVDQTNVELNLLINGPRGFSQTGKSATSQTLPYLGTDSNSIANTNYRLSGGLGDYNMNLFLTSDSVLTRSQKDTGTFNVEVTDSTFSRDKGNGAAGSVVYYDPSVVQQYEVGTYYELSTLDTLSSVSFYMDDANTRRTNKAGLIQCHVYRTTGLSSVGVQQIVTAPIFSSKKVKITDLNIPSTGGWITMKVSNNTAGQLDTAGPGGLVVAYVADQFFGTDTIFVNLEGRDGFQSHYFLRQEQGGTWGNWGYSTNKTFIRLNTVPNDCPKLNGTVNTTSPSSCGASDGTATVIDPTTGTAPYYYSWSTGATTKTAGGLNAATNYYVTITDSKGCANPGGTTVNVVDPNGAEIQNNVTTPVLCAGKEEGKITFNLKAGANGAGYTFIWDKLNNTGGRDTISAGGGATKADSTLSGVETGTYTVYVYDGGTPPCQTKKTFIITGATDPISIAAIGNGTTVTDDLNGVVTVKPVATGGTITTGLIHTWVDSKGANCIPEPNNDFIVGDQNSAHPNQQKKDTYTLTVTDDNNCTSTEDYVIDGTVGFSEVFGADYQMKLFPNPNNGTFKVTMLNAEANDYTFEVKNMIGQVVYSEKVSVNGEYNNTISLSVNGVYFLNVSNGVNTESYKVVVE